MKNLLNLEYSSEKGSLNKSESVVRRFELMTSKKESESATFTAPIDFELSEFLVFEYSMLGFYRGKAYRSPLIYVTAESGEIVPLVCIDDCNTDGRRYSITSHINPGKYVSISVCVSVDRAKRAELSVYSLYTASADELPVSLSEYTEKQKDGIAKIDISDSMNGSYDPLENEISIGARRIFDSCEITPHGIPFKVVCSGNNAVFPDPAPKENDDIITNFKVKARRRLCRPVSRDSKNKFYLGKSVSEIYFVLGLEGMAYQRYTFATEGNILGHYGGEVTMPLSVDDVEGFYVEIIYKCGKRDTALPKNLTEDRFSVSGAISVYAVATDYEEVESIIFHNRKLDTDFPILALSVNELPKRYYPELLIPQAREKNTVSVQNVRCIEKEGNILTVKNKAVSMRFDLSFSMRVLGIESCYSKELKCTSPSLIKFKREKDKQLLFPKVTGVEILDGSAVVTLAAEDFLFTLDMNINEDDRVIFSLNVNNNSQTDEKITVYFPCIDEVTSSCAEDLYYFVPKYQNLDSDESCVICEESSPSFPMQFMTVYSKNANAGLGLLTREREAVVRIYRLEKRDGKVGFCVEYPEMYGRIGKGGSFSCSTTVLEAKEGSYKSTFESYKSWLDSWYVPYKCQNKQWYRECFWLLAEITDFFECYDFVKFPIWHEHPDENGKVKFNFIDILEEQKELSGCYPDILHMWHWTCRYDENGKKHVKWGNYGGEDYDLYGGLDSLRSALDEFQNEKGVYSSMYMHPTLFASSYPHFKDYERFKVVNEEGKNIQLSDSFRMCHANDTWRKYAIDQYPRVYRELGVPILYVDEFGLRIENRCYADGHGHPVPSNLLKTDRDFISELKDAVPEELVLYGEYAAVDINARYIDCNITYGIIDSVSEMVERSWRSGDTGTVLGRIYPDFYRFAFPKIVQLVLPMAMRNLSWHPQKFIFYNGEAIYDSFWDLEESAGHEFACKAYRIKKKYADCFSSDTPETMIDSPSPAICINKFPGKNRTVYNLYNRAYRTYRGTVLRLPHRDGVSYYDVWNDREAKVSHINGYDEVFSEIDAQSVGCILVTKV